MIECALFFRRKERWFMSDGRDLREATEEITDWDWRTFEKLTSVELDVREKERIVCPERVFEQNDPVLAIHWHPEMVPIPLVQKRIEAIYPHPQKTLITPPKQNKLLIYEV
jgi:hypothetical protein